MTYPTKPAAAYDYTAYQASNPSDPLPADELEGDLADHKTSIDEIIEFQKLAQRSDGNLQNGSVRPETLSPTTLALMGDVSFEGDWVTATAYAVNDIVLESNITYICLEAHTSGTFATDLAAGKWQAIDGGTARLSANNDFTGDNTFTTQAAGDDSTKAATTAFVQDAVGRVEIQVFTASDTYTPSTGMVTCIIECLGGGGGGGGVDVSGTANTVTVGGGGGAGGYSRKLATAADIGVSKAVTIGAAGTAGTAGDNDGGAGGDTSVGTLCIGKGGSGGSGGSATVGQINAGGAGGVAGTGDVTAAGARGGTGATGGFNLPRGASSLFGSGGQAVPATSGTKTDGGAAAGYGSGGGGGYTFTGQTDAAGGAGTAGLVIITEFCNQ